MMAYPMKTVEFLYEFMDANEFDTYKEEWGKQGFDPLLFIYPDQVVIWLLSV